MEQRVNKEYERLNSHENRYLRFVGLLDNKSNVLEIGALNRPTVSAEKANISYADFATKSELVDTYRHIQDFDVENIVDVDYVVKDGDYFRSVENKHPGKRFDLILGSHVGEHVPDFIGWLKDMSRLLSDGGILSLILPDKRFTFDILKEETSTAQWLSAHEARLVKPSADQIYRHVRKHLPLKGIDLWNVPSGGVCLDFCHGENEVWDIVSNAFLSGNYFDSHCSIFTPQSFLENVYKLQDINVLPLSLVSIEDTVPGAIDFFVRFQKTDYKHVRRFKRSDFAKELPYLKDETSNGARISLKSRAVE